MVGDFTSNIVPDSACPYWISDLAGVDWICMRTRMQHSSPAMLFFATGALALLFNDDQIEQTSRAMKAMSHPLRLKIISVLDDQEVSVQDIVEKVGTSQSNISQHLAIMRDKGVLRTRKDANRVYYRVGDIRTLEVLKMMREVFCGFGD